MRMRLCLRRVRVRLRRWGKIGHYETISGLGHHLLASPGGRSARRDLLAGSRLGMTLKKRATSFLFALVLLILTTSSALAQIYYFRLDQEIIDVYWNEDGTLTLKYMFFFYNDTFADRMEWVDVGIPNSNFSLSNVTASVDNHNINIIEHSPYVSPGVAVGLGNNAIRPGATGHVTVTIRDIRGVLFTDDLGDEYASAKFYTSWFDSEYVYGITSLTVIYHLPPGVQPNEPRWHSSSFGFPSAPIAGHDSEGRITYSWTNENANGYTQYRFGASFPAKYVPKNTISSPTIMQRLNISKDAINEVLVFGTIVTVLIGVPAMILMAGRRRKMQYLPPKIRIEGHGVKRGLTAIEAAVVMERPLDQILTMILFAVLKKGSATVTKREPLEIEAISPQPKKIRAYEKKFIEAYKKKGLKRRRFLQTTMVKLIRSVSKKMKGFSRKDTAKYYKKIMRKAWAQVEAAETPDIKSATFDEVLEWIMLDRDFDDRTRDLFRNQPVVVPRWWSRYDPGYRGARSTSRPSSGSTGKTPTSLPHLPGSDFAASVALGVESFAGGVLGSIHEFTIGITNKTNPLPKSSSGSKGASGAGGWRTPGGGGGTCACACACAGCACACAGGGR